MLFLIALITNLLIVDNAFADKGFYEQHKNNEAIIDRPFVQINVSQMINWLKNAANNGNIELQVLLGDIYFYGHEINADYNEAKKWYKMAAKRDNQEAQRKLAYMYEYGLGGRQSYQKSSYWRNLAMQ